MKLFLLVMLATAGIGAFVSNTGTVALMLPIVVSMAAGAGMNAGRLLMPLAFASSMGGMMTLIGTPPNLIIQDTLVQAGYGELSFFSFLPVGLVCVTVGTLVLLPLTKWFLSKRGESKGKAQGGKSLSQLVKEYGLSSNLFRVSVEAGSPAAGQSIASLDVRRKYGLNVLEVRRKNAAQHRFLHTVKQFSTPDTVLAAGEELGFLPLRNDHAAEGISASVRLGLSAMGGILFLDGGKTLVSAGYDRMICLWDLSNYTLIKAIEHPAKDSDQKEDMIVSIDCIENSPEPFIAVAFMNGNVGIYDIKFEQPMLLFKAHDENLMNLKISPFDSSIATGSQDKTAKVWILKHRPTHQTTLSHHKSLILALAFKPNGKMLLTGSKDETICGWDYSKSELLFEIIAHKNTVFEIFHHPTENAFVSCSGEGLVCYWTYDNSI